MLARNQDRNHCVMVVDDDLGTLRVLERFLRSESFHVEFFSESRAALEATRRNSYDTIVSDILMPHVDGFAFLRAFREFNQHTPIIFMTGAAYLEEAINALEQGVFRYLIKPISRQKFIADVRAALAMSSTTVSRVEHQETFPSFLPNPRREEIFGRAMRAMWMAYQPIVSWNERKIFGYEALLRSKEASLAQAIPFLAEAECLARVHEVGRAARSAVAQIAPQLASDVLLFNNLHPQDLWDPELYDKQAPLSQHAGRVVIEITERTAQNQQAELKEQVAALRKLGYTIAIDDLGVAYSGLSRIVELEPEIVKIDMSLVRDIHCSTKCQHMVESILRLADRLGILAVAEGVEAWEELDCLTALGCNFFQGFLFAHPAAGFPRLATDLECGRTVRPELPQFSEQGKANGS